MEWYTEAPGENCSIFIKLILIFLKFCAYTRFYFTKFEDFKTESLLL